MVQVTSEQVTALLPLWIKGKERPPETYREPRREGCKARRELPIWNRYVAANANRIAKIDQRQKLCNSAREAAAKAFVNNKAGYTPAVGAIAMLEVYSQVKSTRAVSRIKRELQKDAGGRSKHYGQRRRAH